MYDCLGMKVVGVSIQLYKWKWRPCITVLSVFHVNILVLGRSVNPKSLACVTVIANGQCFKHSPHNWHWVHFCALCMLLCFPNYPNIAISMWPPYCHLLLSLATTPFQDCHFSFTSSLLITLFELLLPINGCFCMHMVTGPGSLWALQTALWPWICIVSECLVLSFVFLVFRNYTLRTSLLMIAHTLCSGYIMTTHHGTPRLPLEHPVRIQARDAKLLAREIARAVAIGAAVINCPCRICNKGIRSHYSLNTVTRHVRRYGMHAHRRGKSEVLFFLHYDAMYTSYLYDSFCMPVEVLVRCYMPML